MFLSHLQKVPSITVTAFQEVSMPLLRCKVGNVAWDTDIKAVQDRQHQLWPARCAQKYQITLPAYEFFYKSAKKPIT